MALLNAVPPLPPYMPSIPLYTSQALVPGQVYTRHDLRDRFNIVDKTLDTGVFKPRGTRSVWLFVTEEKEQDQTQYQDQLDGNMLQWQGQMSGRTDKLILTHQAEGSELLVFYRKNKAEHPGAGFRYLSRFVYESHHSSHPTSFILIAESKS